MEETLFFILLVAIVLTFIIAVPALLYKGIQKVRDPVAWWLLPIFSILALLLLGMVLQANIFVGSGDVLAGTLVMAALMLLLVTLAVIAPFPFFEGKIRISPSYLFPPLISAGVYLLFMASLGESREGGPLSMFSPLLPITGWAIDGAAQVLQVQDAVYAAGRPVHTLILAAGLYLEVFIIAGVFYLILSLLPGVTDKKPDDKSA